MMNTGTGTDSPTSADGDDVVMTMLEHHVPLALVMDLTDRGGPGSAEIFAREGEPEDHWWER
jgi:hypothetical protein